ATPIAFQRRCDPAIVTSWPERYTLRIFLAYLARELSSWAHDIRRTNQQIPCVQKREGTRGPVVSVPPRQRERWRGAEEVAKLDTSRGDQPFRASTRRHRGRRFASCSQRRTGHSMFFFRFLCWRADSKTDLFACTQPPPRHIFLFCTLRQLAKRE